MCASVAVALPLPPLRFAAIVFTRCRLRQMDPGVATGNPNEKIPVRIAAYSQNQESERAPHQPPTGETERQAQLLSPPHLCERGFSPIAPLPFSSSP